MITRQSLIGKAQEEMHKLQQSLANPSQSQHNILLSILYTNKNTCFGAKHHFGDIQSAQQYRNTVPVHTYEDYADYIEQSKLSPGVLTADPITYWARTSGSSGTAKLIPQTAKSLKSWDLAAERNLFAYLLHSSQPLAEQMINSGRIISVTGPHLVERINGVPVGYISGIMAFFDPLLHSMNPIPESVMQLADFDDRLYETAKYALKENVIGIVGITSFSLNLLHYIKFHAAERFLHLPGYNKLLEPAIDSDGHIQLTRLWPHFKMMLSTGVLYEKFKGQVQELLGEVWVADFYSGTEGAYAFTYKQDDPGMTLNVDLYFFEFKDMASGEEWFLDEVKLNTPYEMILTNCGGLYRYTSGDIVEFVRLSPPQIKVTGRTKSIVNLAGEKLNESEIAYAVNDSLEQLHLTAVAFLFTGWIDPECYVHHCLAIEINESVSAVYMQSFMDTFANMLKKIRIAYRNHASTIIKAPHFVLLKPGTIEKLERSKSNQAGITGHTKLKTMVSVQELRRFIDPSYVIAHNLPDNMEIL